MDNLAIITPTNIAIRMEIDRRRELLAELNLDDSMLSNNESEEEEEKFNPFAHKGMLSF